MRTIVSLPGDGIGKVVLEESIRVLNAVGFEANYVHGDIGWEFWCKEGNALPERTIKLLEEHKIGLFGAITSKPKDDAVKELAPELQDKGYVYFSPIVGLRQHFNLDICVRPCKAFKGNPLNFIRKDGKGGFEEPAVDAVIFRQNTEGMYGGIEWTNPPKNVRDAFETHPKMKGFKHVPSEEMAISTRIVTKKATERIIRAAFEYAKKFGYKNVTVCEKPNVLRETSGMYLKTAK
jgi:3-isopropylmalate dehydrogenase